MIKRVNLNLIFVLLALAKLADLFLPHPFGFFADPGSAILISLALSAAAAGASAGLSYALTPKPKKPDPLDRGKLDDLRFSLPAYGAQIPKAWGTARVAPIWVWHTPTIDVPITTPGQSGGKGGGGTPPTPDVTEHRYFKNLAGVFHDGPIQHVARMWFDNELVMNTPLATNLATTASTRYEAEDGVKTGTATVSTQAECSDGRKVTGIGNGGSLTIHCDVAATGTYEVAIGYTSTTDKVFQISVNGGTPIALSCPSSGGAGLVAVQTVSLSLTSGANTIAFDHPTQATPDLDYIAIATALTFTSGVDPRSFTGLQTPGRIAPTDLDVSWPINDEPPVFTDPTGGLAGNNQQTATLAKWGSPQIRIYLGSETQEPDSLIESIKGVGNTSAYRGLAYIVIEGLMLQNGRVPNVTIEFVEGTRAPSAILNNLAELVGLTPANDLDTSALNGLILGDTEGFNPGTYSAITWSGLNNATQTSGGAITKTSGTNNTWNAYATQGSTVSAGTDAAIRFTAGNSGTYMLGFSTTATPGSSLPNPYNQVLFAIILNETGNPSQTAKKAIQMSLGGSNNTTDIGVWAPGDTFQVEIRNGRFMLYQNGQLLNGFTPPPATFPLHPVFMGYSTGGGPSAASYATGSNIGSEPLIANAGALILDSQREAGELVEELMTRFQFILPEVDSKIKAVRLDASSDLTLEEWECQAYRGDDLPPKVQISRKNPLTFPKKTIVNYADPQLDYHANAQVEQRLYGPQKGTLNVSLAMVETGANMKKLAAVLSARAEVEGQTYRFTVGPRYKHIHQGTVLTIAEGSSTHQVRVINFRPDLPAGIGEVEAVRQSSVFDPTVAVSDVGVEDPIVPIPGNTIGVALDGPLLRPEDAGDGSMPVLYVGMCGRGSGNWPAGLMHKEFPANSGGFVLETTSDKPSGIGLGSGPQDTATIFTPSGKPGSGGVDGTIARSGEATYAGARNAATGSSVDPAGTSLLYAENTVNAGLYDVLRSLLHFDTSSIPDNALILSATLSLYGKNKSADTNDSIVVVGSLIVSATDYAVADFDLFDSTRFSADLPISGLSVNAYNAFPLNAAGIAAINKSGTTKLAIRTGKDVDNVTPTARRFMNFSSADVAGTGEDPKLTVIWIEPGLDAVANANVWDRTSVMTVDFYSNPDLSSVPEENLLLNPELNLIGVQNPSDGEVEYLQFANATALTATAPFVARYELDTFLRGRAMTEHNVSNHTAQDTVIVIDSSIKPRRFNISELGQTLDLRFLTAGQQIDHVPDTPITLEGRSLKPASVVNITGLRDSGNDLLIEFMGRTRIGGGLRALQGGSLGEEVEEYRVRPVGTDRIMPVIPGMALAAMFEGDGSSKFASITNGSLSIAAGDRIVARSYQKIERTGNFVEATLSAIADVGSEANAIIGLVPGGIEWRKHVFPSTPGNLHLTDICPLLVILSHSDLGRTVQVNEYDSVGLAAFNVSDGIRVHITLSGTEMRVSLSWAGQGTPAVFRSSNIPACPVHALAFVGCLSGADTAAVSKTTMTAGPLPKIIYAADQQSLDGFTPGDPIQFDIWQHSTLIGDGNETRITL